MSKKKKISRREFIGRTTVVAGGVAGLYGVAGLPALGRKTGEPLDDLFHKHYKKLTSGEIDKILRKIEEGTKAKYGREVKVADDKPIDNVIYGYGLNLTICIGCRKCVEACVKENNQSRDPRIEYIRVLEMKKGQGIDVEKSEHKYEHEVPAKGKFYMPVQCQHCDNPPCVKVCPVQATWKEKDGIVVIDYNWCIGCRYCSAACPYFARKFNFHTPEIPSDEINPEQGYLGNRIRGVGVMEKCTFCIQRVRRGLFPACHEACPTGARKFGDLNDEKSEIRQVLATKDTYVFKSDLGTIPKFYYYFD